MRYEDQPGNEHLRDEWLCKTCCARFPASEIFVRFRMHCPRCDATDIEMTGSRDAKKAN